MSADDKELHLWAAQGLAYTCWITYADHETGLGPDEMDMEDWNDDPAGVQGKWVDHVKEWKRKGRPGDVPPGLQEVQTKERGQRDYSTRQGAYLLRPEVRSFSWALCAIILLGAYMCFLQTVESFYLLWRLTGDEKWRERGWTVFEAIEREAKTSSGYASLSSVETSPAPKKNEMPRQVDRSSLQYEQLF